LHLVYGKLKPSKNTLPLLDQITAGLVYHDLLVLGEKSNTLEIVQYMRRPDEHYVSRYKLRTPSFINKVVQFREKLGKSVKFILT
jgi:GTP cyclohydrolase FolE2